MDKTRTLKELTVREEYLVNRWNKHLSSLTAQFGNNLLLET